MGLELIHANSVKETTVISMTHKQSDKYGVFRYQPEICFPLKTKTSSQHFGHNASNNRVVVTAFRNSKCWCSTPLSLLLCHRLCLCQVLDETQSSLSI